MTRPEEREQFEEWARLNHVSLNGVDILKRDGADGYANRLVGSEWRCWQAARASLPVALPPRPEPSADNCNLAGDPGRWPIYSWNDVRAYARAAIEAASRGTGDAWVSVEERLPEDGADVWIASYAGVEKARYTVEGDEYLIDAIHDMMEAQSGVTHWMPYETPAPPTSAHPGAGDDRP